MQAVLPTEGYAGWRYLSATVDRQVARIAESPLQARDRDHFRNNIGNVGSATDLVSDYRLLRVALGAFGLQDDLANRAFIERVLAEGTTSAEALSNRLADKRYRQFSEAFGLGEGLPPRTRSPGFAERIIARFDRQEFERAVGVKDQNMRLALTAARELPDLAARGLSESAGWLTILGNPPLRRVFETALGLPASVGSLPLDRQIDDFKAAAERVLGHAEIARFGDPDATEHLVRFFTLRAQLLSGPPATTPGMVALTLLRGST